MTDEEWELIWKALPKRGDGGNSKGKARRIAERRIKEGANYRELLDGSNRYRAWCDAKGMSNTKFVKMGCTFFGPDKHYQDEFLVSDATNKEYRLKKAEEEADIAFNEIMDNDAVPTGLSKQILEHMGGKKWVRRQTPYDFRLQRKKFIHIWSKNKIAGVTV